jgi:ferritin-like metal-binding protein YciE
MYQLENLKDFLDLQLKAIYSAEHQVMPALEKMAGACKSEELRIAFMNHLRQTQVHIERIRDCAIEFQFEVEGHDCEAMKGLIAECEAFIKSKETADPDVLDAAFILCAQKVEHYEIAMYATLITYMEIVGYKETATTIKSTLSEEKETDEKLTKIAGKLKFKSIE